MDNNSIMKVLRFCYALGIVANCINIWVGLSNISLDYPTIVVCIAIYSGVSVIKFFHIPVFHRRRYLKNSIEICFHILVLFVLVFFNLSNPTKCFCHTFIYFLVELFGLLVRDEQPPNN